MKRIELRGGKVRLHACLDSPEPLDVYKRQVLPQGVIDLEHNIPASDINLIGTTNAVVVREDLHPEIIDLLAKTLVEVHGGAGIFQRPGEFPTPTAVSYTHLDVYKRQPLRIALGVS